MVLLFAASAQAGSACVTAVAPDPRSVELAQGSFIEVKIKTDLHEKPLIIQGKYLGFSNGLVIKWVERGILRYGTIRPADIVGKPRPLIDPNEIQDLKKALEEAV